MKTNRTLTVIVLAVVLMMAVIACAVGLTISGLASREKYTAQAGWNAPASAAASVNITDLTGDKQRDVFAQDANGLKVLDAQGKTLLDKPFPQAVTSTLGDLDGDGVPDIVAYTWTGERARVLALTGQDKTLWDQQLANLGQPGRAAVVDFENDRRSEVVVGDQQGRLVALSAQGEELWRYALPAGVLRGLDNATQTEGDIVVAGQEAGPVVVLDKQGREMWRANAAGGLRRLRAFPLGGPREGRVFVGSVNGKLSVHQPANGQEVWSANLGQAVNEIRPAEIDGNPATTEIIVGGKDGGIWAFSQTGQQLWAGSVGDNKVNELVGLTLAQGQPLVLVGDDSGQVTIFDAQGVRQTSIDAQGSIGRIEPGKLTENGFIVADANRLTLYSLTQTSAPFWYSPLLAGALACVVIGVAAYFVASLKPAPTLRVSAEEMSVEAQRARRLMLHESINDLKRMQQRGEVAGEAYLARLKELRAQLAEVNTALIKLGEPIKPESFACPHCGGPLELGADRCDYCGQTVIV